MQYQIDYIDQEILKILNKDARFPYSEIAKTLGISNSLVHQRVKKMMETGIVESTTVKFHAKSMGVFDKILHRNTIKRSSICRICDGGIKKIEEITECNFVSGNYAIFVLIFARDNEDLRRILYQQVHLIEGVAGTDTFISFDTCFERSIPIKA